MTVGLAARSLDQLQALSASLPGEHHEYECDVCSSESVQAAIDSFAADAGGIELLVANAGITHYGPFRDEPLENALRMSEVNWHGTLRTVHYGLPYMLDRGRGQIVVISSGAALRSFPWAAVYGGTKAAQRLFAEARARTSSSMMASAAGQEAAAAAAAAVPPGEEEKKE